MRKDDSLKSKLTKEAESRVTQSDLNSVPIKEADIKKELIDEATQ